MPLLGVRQARVDALPPVRGFADIASRLSDSYDEAYPIYRNMTLHTVILDGPKATLSFWCCGRRAVANGSLSEPAYRWNLLTFFGQAQAGDGQHDARAAAGEK